ncbi:hypothetical protein MtrunA17_Chr8g0339361 [Medicago truncatula]|uniref:Transmembrane protein n=1 Tax=Medicago truncatula TaxID=3880 RepID=A0A396GBM6_MEDTR|nr:hypothetical protein MtrunA17_Chr8g0339361 [Medicago truncatula]
MGSKKDSPVNVLSSWLRNRSMKVKIFLGILLAFCAVVTLKLTIKDLELFYIASNTIHILGLFALIYKLYVHKSCSGKFLNFSSLIRHCLDFFLLEKISLCIDLCYPKISKVSSNITFVIENRRIRVETCLFRRTH